MGRGKRIIPAKMPEKLKTVRLSKNLTMEQMGQALENELLKLNYSTIKIHSGHIAEFEQGKREPLLPILLAYTKLSKISLECLVDNEVDLT
jgi:transcriptional regulator with XRE-family HTH domain